VLHKCDNVWCVNPDHLYLGDQRDNMRDAVARGRRADRRGEGNGNATLTADDAALIRQSPLSGKVLASLLGVRPAAISKVRRGRTWR
jgi:hypothetical protein